MALKLPRLIYKHCSPTSVRFMKTTRYAEKRKKTPCNLALEYFDMVYEKYFGYSWPSIRIALLSPQKYMAMLNNFGDADNIEKKLQLSGCLDFQAICNELSHECSLNKTNLNQNDVTSHIQMNKLNFKSKTKEEIDDFENRLVNPKTKELLGSLHDFVPSTKFKGRDDFIFEEDLEEFEASYSSNISMIREETLEFPRYLRVYTFPRGITYEFETPQKGVLNFNDHYLIDGGNVLSILALNLQLGDRVLEIGGCLDHSLAFIQSSLPGYLCICHQTTTEMKEMKKEFNKHFNELDPFCEIVHCGLTDLNMENDFDKVIVNSVSSNDRYSANYPGDNIFSARRIKERLGIPHRQKNILLSAMNHVKLGGALVYTTKSMSKLENDGVVKVALEELAEKSNMKFIIKDLSQVFKPLSTTFCFADRNILNYGQLVIPNLMNNFGPTYICKMIRVK